jgi:amino acid adenylation domain-containing protein
MLVQEFLQHSAARQPDKVALVCGGQRLTYAQIETIANRLANAMITHGVNRGDRVAIYLGNSVEAVVAIFATLLAGGVFVVINPTTKAKKLEHLLTRFHASALVTGTKGLGTDPWRDVVLHVPSLQLAVCCGKSRPEFDGRQLSLLYFEELKRDGDATAPPRVNIDLDLACLVYTSGSTGEPKGVMCDHSSVVFVARSITQYLRNVDKDVVLNVLPLSFSYGLYQLLATFMVGGRLVLEESFAYPVIVLQQIQKEHVTGFPGVPTIYSFLVSVDLSRFDLSSLRYMTNAAAALPVAHLMKLRRDLPWVEFYSMYGLTEVARSTWLPPDQVEQRPTSVGIPIPGTEAWIEDEAGNRVGPGIEGELVIRGRHVMRGYWDDPQATAERFRPGSIPGERLCYTGDIFRSDEAGYLYFVSRKDDIIKTRGEKVAPKEVEDVLCTLPNVKEAAVVGVPDPVLGQAIKAVIVARDTTLTQAEVLTHCQRYLEDFMVPKHVEFRNELPKTPSGKTIKSELV